MKLQHHFLISFFSGLIYLLLVSKAINFYNLTPWLVGGVLVDIDHLLTYSTKKKTFNFKTIVKIICEDYKQNNQHFFIFHTLEFAVFLGFVVSKTFLPWQFLAGYLIHLSCDGFRQRRLRKNYSWFKKWSLCLNFLK